MQFKITVFYDSIALYDFFMIFEILNFMKFYDKWQPLLHHMSVMLHFLGVEAGPSFFFARFSVKVAGAAARD